MTLSRITYAGWVNTLAFYGGASVKDVQGRTVLACEDILPMTFAIELPRGACFYASRGRPTPYPAHRYCGGGSLIDNWWVYELGYESTWRNKAMDAMQYEITLPADYDMEIIRRRVAANGYRTDAFPGLGLKAYLIRVRNEDAATVNQYAPFYLWVTIDGMRDFLLGAGFRGLCASFGRPVVRRWLGLAFQPGPAFTAVPTVATRRITALDVDDDLTDVVAHACSEMRDIAATPLVHSTALALDLQRGELVQFTLGNDSHSALAGTHYHVLHLSAPSINALTHSSATDCVSSSISVPT